MKLSIKREKERKGIDETKYNREKERKGFDETK